MFWYILLAILPSLLGLLYGINGYDLEKKHHKKSYVFLCSAAIFFMIAFRNQSVGSVDSSTYYSLWETASGLNFAQFSTVTAGSSMEFGFLIFVWLFSRLFSSAQMLFILSGFFFAVSIGCYMYKYCCNPVLGYTMYITLGLYTFTAQGLRQAIAMSICLFTIEFARKRKFLQFVLLILLAATFHRSAILFLVIYFMYGKRVKSVWSVLIFAMYGIWLLLTDSIMALGNLIFDRNYQGTVESGGTIAVIIYLLIIVCGFLFVPKDRSDDEFSLFMFITSLGCCIYLMRYVGVQAAERVSFYFMYGQIILLPAIFDNFNIRSRTLANICVIGACIILFYYRLGSSRLVPYLFFWQ